MADLEEMFTANVTTAFVACRAVLPAMIARRSGSIVNFASTAGEYGSISPAAHYAAAKGAVIAMTKSLAREASPHNVRVNAISPGPTDTSPSARRRRSRRRPSARGRCSTASAVPRRSRRAASTCVSDMSSFETGTVLQVNGGSLLVAWRSGPRGAASTVRSPS